MGFCCATSLVVGALDELESGRFQGFLSFLTGNMSDHFITVRCGTFFGGLRHVALAQKDGGNDGSGNI